MAFDFQFPVEKFWSIAMTPEFIVEFATQAITLTIFLSMPMLGVGLIVGLMVSVFQAVTQIQEMTLTFVPKIIAVFLSLLFAAPWMLGKITVFTTRIFENIPLYIR
jgi:flagellar biosynthetic protein FliQ